MPGDSHLDWHRRRQRRRSKRSWGPVRTLHCLTKLAVERGGSATGASHRYQAVLLLCRAAAVPCAGVSMHIHLADGMSAYNASADGVSIHIRIADGISIQIGMADGMSIHIW